MSHFNRFLLLSVWSVVLIPTNWTTTDSLVAQQAQELGKAANANYAEVLAAGLKCRRPQEFAFVKSVAKQVESGQLPRELVDSTFFWARRQIPYPYVHFEFGLKLRAKKAGYEL